MGLVFPFAWAGANSPADPFVQDQFAIGLWVDPPADDKMDRRYAEIAEVVREPRWSTRKLRNSLHSKLDLPFIANDNGVFVL